MDSIVKSLCMHSYACKYKNKLKVTKLLSERVGLVVYLIIYQ